MKSDLVLENISQYVRESNAIEGVFASDALHESVEAWYLLLLSASSQLTSVDILNCHRAIMLVRWPEIAGKTRGELQVDVQVGGRAYVPYENVDELLKTWALAGRRDKTALGCLRRHIWFEHIHPFRDGNGRVGRMLYWYECLHNGHMPILFRNDDKAGYYALFNTPVPFL